MKKHAILLGTILLGLASALSYAQAPVPFISLPLVPDATPPGGPEFTLTVNGTGFVSNSVVNWNGNALATQFVSGSQLTATVPAADIATANTGWVTVVNPTPGWGTSNTAFFTVTANEGVYVGFASGSSPTWGNSVAVGDFNGDGKLDLAAGGGNTTSILLGDGQGNFTLASTVPAGGTVAVGDFNGDGKLDLVVGSSIFLGDGTGNFTLASTLPVAGAVAVGDFNGDGKLDLAFANYWSDTVYVLLGDGKGHFSLAWYLTTPFNWPDSVAVGDFNGDGKLDLAVANFFNYSVSILLGDGTGNFTWKSDVPIGGCGLAVGDFNGDGKLDLASTTFNTEYGNGELDVALGDGTGNFTRVYTQGFLYWTSPVVAGDFNGDGKLDLAVGDCGNQRCSKGRVSIMLGDGTGNFTRGLSPVAVRGIDSLAVGDFNGDGKLDLAVASIDPGMVNVLLHGVPPMATLSPSNLSFGTQLFGKTISRQTTTLSNRTRAALNITSITTSNPNFSQRNNCGSSLAAGASCTLSVIFRPYKVGAITGTITITDDAPNSPQTIWLTGVSTEVALSSSSLDFGDQSVGTTGQPQTVTFTNYAKHASLNIASIRFTGSNLSSFAQTNTCGTSVPAGGSCTISVTFTPNGTGPKTATLTVHDNGGASPQTVALSGTGT